MSDAPNIEEIKFNILRAGEPAPWFTQSSTSNPQYTFSSVGGHYALLGFFGTAADESIQAQMQALNQRKELFDDDKACFFGISIDPDDLKLGRLRQHLPGQRHFWDFDHSVSKLYGAAPCEGPLREYRRFWMLLDPTLRIMHVFPMLSDASNVPDILSTIDALPPPARFSGVELMAPVLYLPNVFEPEFCKYLIDIYKNGQPEDSGFMREVDGLTTLITDYSFKRRSDCNIADVETIKQIQLRILKRINPEILKVFQFQVTRMERYIVGHYSSQTGGHFNPHRDNTSKGTAHRRFAVSINLNDDFEGGELYFPEYGPRTFKPPVGAAVVFSCSLLHAVTSITRGDRYAFLPFLYDDAAAAIRQANNQFLHEGVAPYQA